MQLYPPSDASWAVRACLAFEEKLGASNEAPKFAGQLRCEAPEAACGPTGVPIEMMHNGNIVQGTVSLGF